METANDRDFKGIWIPKEIWLDEKLTVMEKVFLVEIDSLDNSEGCYASNKYFSEFFGISKGRCTQIIKELEAKGFITIKVERDGKMITKRVIRVVRKLTRVVRKLNTPSEKTKYPYLENDEENNTSINNTSNKKKPVRHKHGEFGNVLLTDEQKEKLITDYSKPIIDDFIRKVDEYCQQHGKKYSDYYLTIRNWINKDNIKPTDEPKREYRVLK